VLAGRGPEVARSSRVSPRWARLAPGSSSASTKRSFGERAVGSERGLEIASSNLAVPIGNFAKMNIDNFKKDFLSRRKLLLYFLCLIVVVGIVSYGGFFIYGKFKALKQERDSLDIQNIQLEEQLNKAQEDIQKKEELLEKKNKEISELQKKINSLSRSASSTTVPAATTIYERIKVSSDFRPQIIRSINLLRQNVNKYYQILNQQVGYIYQTDYCGGIQMKRDIYMGDCDGMYPDSIIASMIVHEAMHVYNVYVNGVYSKDTKEQELPSYQAELEAAKKLNAPKYFIDFLYQQIEYWNKK